MINACINYRQLLLNRFSKTSVIIPKLRGQFKIDPGVISIK